MHTKSDWDAASDAFMTAERERLGGPPTLAEITAFLRGELRAAEADRIRALLVYTPELTHLLELRRAPRRRLWPRYTAIAAIAAMAFVGGLLLRPRDEPRLAGTYVLESLQARGARGGRGVELSPNEDVYVLHPQIAHHYSRYRIDLVRGDEIVWSASYGSPEFAVTLTREFLGREAHRLDIRGDGQLLESFDVRVTPR